MERNYDAQIEDAFRWAQHGHILTAPPTSGPHRIDLDLIYPPHLVLLPQCTQPVSSIGSETRLTTLWSSPYPLQPSSPSHPLGLPFEHPVTIPSDHFYPRPPILRQCPITSYLALSYLALSSDALTRMALAP